MYKLFGFVIVIFLIYFHKSLPIKVKEIRFSRKCYGYNIKTIDKTSLSSCAQKCNYKVQCESINYNRPKKLCELNSVSSSDCVQLQVAPGWIFSDKSKWLFQEPSQCKSYPCKQTETCMEKGASFECKVEECHPIPELKNGTVLGNMNSIGSVLAFVCKPNYTLLGLNNSVCDETGQWTSFLETRCELLCPHLSSFHGLEITEAYINTEEGFRYVAASNASDLSSLVAMQGSNVTYRCTFEPLSYLIGNPVSTCVSGEWLQSISCIDKCPDYKSYSYSLYECVAIESCFNGYADTFHKYNATVMWFKDDDTIINVSEQNCLATCLSDPQCNSFDYWHFPKICYIQRLQHVDISVIGTNMSAWSYYQRNCN